MIRTSRLRFTAINESGFPFLVALLDAARQSPAIRNAMLALAGCLRSPTRDPAGTSDAPCPYLPGFAATGNYQACLAELRSKILDFQHGGAGGDAIEILGCIMMLITAGFPSTVESARAGDWALHISGMVSLVESLDDSVIENTAIGRISRELAAQLSIGAFLLGCKRNLRCAWLEWDIHPPEAPPDSDFSSLEILRGYPKSLLTIIAAVSAVLEQQTEERVDPLVQDTVQRLYDSACLQEGVVGRVSLNTLFLPPPGAQSRTLLSMLDTALTAWEPPEIPSRMSVGVITALTNAWEAMRKAALIYLWRGGFGARVTVPLFPHHARATTKFIREMILVLRALLYATDEQGITMFNSMTWPIIVIANETGTDPDMQGEILFLLREINRRFSMPHLSHLADILRTLWERVERASSDTDGSSVCLEGIAREIGACLPLF